MHAKLRRSIVRTVTIVTISGTLLLVSCGSDSKSSTTTAAPTVGTETTTAGTDSSASTVDTTGSTTGTTAVPSTDVSATAPEGLPENMQSYLRTLSGKVNVATGICPKVGGQDVPVLSMQNQLIATAPNLDEATAAFKKVLPDNPLDVSGYGDQNPDEPGLFLAVTHSDFNPDEEFMRLVAGVNDESAGGTLLSLNFVYSVSQVWRFHPYGPATGNQPAPTTVPTGAGQRTIAVFDSMYPSNFSVPQPSADGKSMVYPSNPPTTDPYPAYGHGPFVATLIKRFAPDASVLAFGIPQGVDPDGVFVSIGDVQTTMKSAFDEQRNPNKADFNVEVTPDIINLSLGAPGCGLTVPVTFGEFLSRIVNPDEWITASGHTPLIVAAAGNSSANVEEYPAAFSGFATRYSTQYPNLAARFKDLSTSVAAVGSMSPGTTIDPDCFSNVGSWVNIWAPGTDQVSYYPYPAGGTDWGKWSGTSFSTARVSAMLATKATADAKSVNDVWAGLSGGPAVPDFTVTTSITTPIRCPP